MPRALAVVALLLAAATQAVLAQGDFKPVDQATSQPEFFAFRARLQAAVARRDREALLAVVHEDIKNSLGGSDGINEFEQIWALDKPRSRLWATLAGVLALGGSFVAEGRVVAPSVFSRWPSGTDPYGFITIIGSGVRVHVQPAESSAALHSLTYEIVEELPNPPLSEGWVAVALSSGKTGYVDKRFARSPLDYRAIFERAARRWRMTMFIAGD